MPNRILREGINDSEAVNSLSLKAELFYRRLMSVVDDYGRYEAHPLLLLPKVFPLQIDRWTIEDIKACLDECSTTQTGDGPLVSVYSLRGKKYLQLNNFGQRTRTVSRYPGPTDEDTPKVSAPTGQVYFVRSPRLKRIKIGYTEWRLESRVAALQTGSSDKLEILGSFPGSLRDERELHQQFSILRLSGEWFTESDELMEFIARKCAHVNASGAQENASGAQENASGAQENASELSGRAFADISGDLRLARRAPASASNTNTNTNTDTNTDTVARANGKDQNRWKLDEQFCILKAGFDDAGVATIDADWADAYFVWPTLDFEQKLAAIDGIRKLKGQDPDFIRRPRKYLETSEWQRIKVKAARVKPFVDSLPTSEELLEREKADEAEENRKRAERRAKREAEKKARGEKVESLEELHGRLAGHKANDGGKIKGTNT